MKDRYKDRYQMEEQDKILDDLLNTMMGIKRNARDIQTELRHQDILLDPLISNVDNSLDKTKKNIKRVKNLEKDKSCCVIL